MGAIFGAVALNLTTGRAYMPPDIRVVAQVMTGAYIGCMITRDEARKFPKVIGPYITVMVTLFVLNIVTGVIFYQLTDLDLLTALFCATPGGMSDTPLIAMDMGADGATVAVMQFVRMIFGLAVLPSIIMISDHMIEGDGAKIPAELPSVIAEHTEPLPRASLIAFLPTLGIALLAGLFGKWTGIPAGTLTATLIVVMALKIADKAPPMPMWLRRVAQVISGCCIGCGITMSQILSLRQMILPAIILLVGYTAACIGMGFVISKVFGMELKEAMLALSPAGATEMALIAADLGVHSTNLVVLQICRLLGVVIIFPQIFALIMRFFA